MMYHEKSIDHHHRQPPVLALFNRQQMPSNQSADIQSPDPSNTLDAGCRTHLEQLDGSPKIIAGMTIEFAHNQPKTITVSIPHHGKMVPVGEIKDDGYTITITRPDLIDDKTLIRIRGRAQQLRSGVIG